MFLFNKKKRAVTHTNITDKGTENRAQNKTNSFVFYAEMEYLM